MKRSLLALGLVFCPLVLQAQNPPAAPKPQLYVLHEEIAKPSMLAQYESTTQEFFKSLAQAKVDPATLTIRTYVSPDFHYYFLAPIDSFGGMDKIMTTFMTLSANAQFQDLMKRGGATMESVNESIIVRRPDLCYTPDNPRLKMEEHNYFKLQYYYLKPGTEMEAEQIARDYAALFKKKNIAEPFTIFMAVNGNDMPLLIASIPAKSAADWVAADERVNAALGADIRPLQARALNITRKFEVREVTTRPDLVYPAPAAAK